VLRNRPALRFVILLSGGIVFAEGIAVSAVALWLCFAATWVCALPLVWRKPGSLLSLSLLHCSVFLLGAVWASVRESSLALERVTPAIPYASVHFNALLEETPVKQGASLKLVLLADLPAGGRSQSRRERFLATISLKKAEIVRDLTAGQTLAVYGTLADFPRPRNPGEFDYGRYLRLKDIGGVVQVDSLRAIGVSMEGSVRSWFAALRARLNRILEEHHGPEAAGFLQGVVFGDRKDISSELKESFLKTGTIHILAVSGSNVALIAMMLYLLLGLARVPRRWVVLFTLAGLMMYMMITGAESSIVRATIMGCVIVIGTAMERRTDIFNSIAVAALVVLLIDPLQLFDAGFQLSFSAVLSIVLLYPRLERLVDAIPEAFEEIRLLIPVWKVFAVSAAAQLGTLPFTAYTFERISLVSFLANIVVVPLVGLNLILACMTIAADAVAGWIAAVYAAINEVLVDILLGFVTHAADVPGATLDTYGFGLLAALAYYAVLFAVFNANDVRKFKLGAFAAMTFLLAMTFKSIVEHDTNLRVTMLDVGQGDGILIKFPNGSHVLVDAGPRSFGYDAGERVVVPFLARHGVGRIDAVVVSHAHSDHIGGLEAVMAAVDVGVIHEPDSLVASALHRRIRDAAIRRGIPVVYAARGSDLSPDPAARLYVLHPPGLSSAGDLNNGSFVLKLVYGRTSMLLTGDAEAEAEATIRSRYGLFLDSDILKAGHHGSVTSSSEDFLNGITPEIALISVGARNKFGHPSPEILSRLSGRGVVVHRTDREGALMYETDGETWKHIEWYDRNGHEKENG